jgi:hypothetical protein
VFEGTESDQERDAGVVSDPDAADSLEGEGGEGAENAQATPDISEAREPGQTSVPAPDEDAEQGEDNRTEE